MLQASAVPALRGAQSRHAPCPARGLNRARRIAGRHRLEGSMITALETLHIATLVASGRGVPRGGIARSATVHE